MSKNNQKSTLFNINDTNKYNEINCNETSSINVKNIPINVFCRLVKYDLESYIEDVKSYGLRTTWDYICDFVIRNQQITPALLDIENFTELYEIGLAVEDKTSKKKNGQYYTPDDVAYVMAKWLKNSDGEAVCDVGCGTGKLILTYLKIIGEENTKKLILSGNLYLYDLDPIALKICKTIIAIKYGLDIANYINDISCDFLDPKIVLPKNSKVISNPPYAKIEKIESYWEKTDVLLDTKELYSSFMEKIFTQAKSTVIITPFSFISGDKFYSLRSEMCKIGNGSIFSFDNVPGNVFQGVKHGIFNTNKTNSVRAAITILNKSNYLKGFRVSQLIRFKNEERTKLFNNNFLKKILPKNYQIINDSNTKFAKIPNELVFIFNNWIRKSKFILENLISKHDSNFFIDVPNTCRYYTTASSRKLNRTGSIILKIKTEREFNFLYCFINSSFAYLWWRIYDGGINYSVNLLKSMPLPLNLLSNEDDVFFKKMAMKLIQNENNYIITKINAGKLNENIKFPEKYRKQINKQILKILKVDFDEKILNSIHSNRNFNE